MNMKRTFETLGSIALTMFEKNVYFIVFVSSATGIVEGIMVLFNRIQNEVDMQRNSTYAVRNITMIAVYEAVAL